MSPNDSDNLVRAFQSVLLCALLFGAGSCFYFGVGREERSKLCSEAITTQSQAAIDKVCR